MSKEIWVYECHGLTHEERYLELWKWKKSPEAPKGWFLYYWDLVVLPAGESTGGK